MLLSLLLLFQMISWKHINKRSPILQKESLKLSCPCWGTPHDICTSSQTAKSTHLQRASGLELWHCCLTQQWNCLPWFGPLILTVILRRISFLWPLGVDVAQREYFSKLPWIVLFLHNRCNLSDAFSAIVSFSQIFEDFSEDEMAVFETKEPSSVSAQLATIKLFNLRRSSLD